MLWFAPKHVHDWKYLTVDYYIDTSYGLRKPSFSGSRQCLLCGEVVEYSVWGGGHPKLEDLNSRLRPSC